MIYLAVGRGPSPLFGTAKLGIKKSPQMLWNVLGTEMGK